MFAYGKLAVLLDFFWLVNPHNRLSQRISFCFLVLFHCGLDVLFSERVSFCLLLKVNYWDIIKKRIYVSYNFLGVWASKEQIKG
jgi:hypothetical protein